MKTEKEISKELAEAKARLGCPLWLLTTYINDDEEQPRTIILKKPNRLTRTASEKVAKTDPYKGVETFLRGMYVGGDDLEEIIKNDDALMIAGETLIDLIKVREGNLQKA